MAIDTAFKRRSSAASRRMPWMRRFGIAPDGTIAQRDRQQGTWVYAGILAGAPPVAIAGGCWHTGQIHLPGFRSGDVHVPRFGAGEVHLPGFRTGERVC